MDGIASLTPEERAALKEALDAAEKDPMSEMAELCEYLCDEIKAVRTELAAVKEAHEALKGLVMEDLIGGLKEAYEGNVRGERMADFKGKYGSMLDPLAEPFKRTFGADLHDKAFDFMDGMRGDEGYSDEVGDSRLKEVIQQIKDKLGISDAPAVSEVTTVEAAPAPEASAEAPAEEEEEAPEEDAQKAWDEIAAMKKKDDARDSKYENREARKRGA
jgi:hypothetical protein